ncbi:protein kinesin light chain-related 1 [Quercus suber]|uniref:Protein kinesin light chain-related 1 n=1 Tax=Quercus suber TaxID=58331 RepID=A0AAW0KIR9_QUESU
MSRHVLAAIYSSLGRFEEAIWVLERAIQVPDPPRSANHAFAAFFGHMQLGDTFSMLGQVDRSIACYEEGLKIQIEALGETDPRVGETCRCLDRWIAQSLAMKKGLRSRSKPWAKPIHASEKLAGLNFCAFDLLNVDWIAIKKCVCCASLFSVRARERASERRERQVFGTGALLHLLKCAVGLGEGKRKVR